MAKRTFFDLVEWAAAENYFPRGLLWRRVAKALWEKELVILNADYCPVPAAGLKTLEIWFYEFNLAMHRSSDAADFARILRTVAVDKKVFEVWLREHGLVDTEMGSKPKLKVVRK